MGRHSGGNSKITATSYGGKHAKGGSKPAEQPKPTRTGQPGKGTGQSGSGSGKGK